MSVWTEVRVERTYYKARGWTMKAGGWSVSKRIDYQAGGWTISKRIECEGGGWIVMFLMEREERT